MHKCPIYIRHLKQIIYVKRTLDYIFIRDITIVNICNYQTNLNALTLKKLYVFIRRKKPC